MSQSAPAQPLFIDASEAAGNVPRGPDDRLARAFLALCDEPDARPVSRSLRGAVAAAGAALALALAGPLALASAAPDPPVAAQKAEAPSPLADDEADGPPA